VLFWDAASGERFAELKTAGDKEQGYHSIRFAPDQRTWAAADINRNASLWDMLTGTQLLKMSLPEHDYFHIAFSNAGRLLAFGGGRRNAALRIWDVARGKEVARLDLFSGPIMGLAFSPDSQLLATSMSNCEVLVWDLAALGIDTNMPAKD